MAGSAKVRAKPSAIQVGGMHYKDFAIQPGIFGEMNRLTFFETDVVKRLCRHSRGGKGMEDLRKAMHELQLIAEVQYNELLYITSKGEVVSEDIAE